MKNNETKKKTDEPKKNAENQIEGEGSYTATRRYNEGVEQSVRAGKSDTLAEEAKRALEGKDGADLKQAEKIGKSGNPQSAQK